MAKHSRTVGDLTRIGDGLESFRDKVLECTGDPSWEAFEARTDRLAEELRAQERRSQREALKRSALPVTNMTLASYKLRGSAEEKESQKAVLRAVAARIKKFPEGRESSIVLYGTNGPGKTHIGIAYAEAVLSLPRFYEVAWYKGDTVLRSIVSSKGYDDPLPPYVGSAALLVLDDVEKTAMDGYKREEVKNAVYQVLDYRYLRDLPMVVTTNLDRQAFEEVFGRASCDRLPERWWHVLHGASYRSTGGTR